MSHPQPHFPVTKDLPVFPKLDKPPFFAGEAVCFTDEAKKEGAPEGNFVVKGWQYPNHLVKEFIIFLQSPHRLGKFKHGVRRHLLTEAEA